MKEYYMGGARHTYQPRKKKEGGNAQSLNPTGSVYYTPAENMNARNRGTIGSFFLGDSAEAIGRPSSAGPGRLRTGAASRPSPTRSRQPTKRQFLGRRKAIHYGK